MNILICDDVHDAALMLKKIIAFSVCDVNIQVFNGGEKVLASIRSGNIPDLCFLDILMPGIDGISLAARMREEGYGGPIVFLTASNDYAAQSYKVEAFSYLLKPPDEKEVAAILHKLKNMLEAADIAGIPVKTKQISKHILFRDISHIEVIRHNVHFRLTDGNEIHIAGVFSEIIPRLLTDKRFAQCHRSFVVNMDAISGIQSNTAIMKCGKNIPISRGYSQFKKLCQDRLSGPQTQDNEQ
ncbi:MAG: LytTR family DNA-binding domain-containing protein [Treponema sp.]|jgi:DNA-binding LytR/AlgR family response regulator|nr:LytTR family DNA-binding domain-containing protein [Treponema sp.]